MVAEWVDKGKAMGLPAGNIISCSIALGNYAVLLTNDFDFHLTDELIADRPQERRDGARADAPGLRPVAFRSETGCNDRRKPHFKEGCVLAEGCAGSFRVCLRQVFCPSRPQPRW